MSLFLIKKKNCVKFEKFYSKKNSMQILKRKKPIFLGFIPQYKLFLIFIDVTNMQDNSPRQALIPLMSSFGEKIEFWIEPFESHCKDRFDAFEVKVIN